MTDSENVRLQGSNEGEEIEAGTTTETMMTTGAGDDRPRLMSGEGPESFSHD